jgi:hypothetical protein
MSILIGMHPLNARKSRELHSCCHNPILGYSPKFTFLKNKNKKNKIKAGNVEKADQEK